MLKKFQDSKASIERKFKNQSGGKEIGTCSQSLAPSKSQRDGHADKRLQPNNDNKPIFKPVEWGSTLVESPIVHLIHRLLKINPHCSTFTPSRLSFQFAKHLCYSSSLGISDQNLIHQHLNQRSQHAPNSTITKKQLDIFSPSPIQLSCSSISSKTCQLKSSSHP